MTKLLRRNNLSLVSLYGESANLINSIDKMELIRNKTKLFKPSHIYNADESSLFFNMKPSYSAVFSSEKQHVKGLVGDKGRVTIMFC